MIGTTELVNRVSTHSRVAKVEGDIGGREPHGLPSLGGNGLDGQSE